MIQKTAEFSLKWKNILYFCQNHILFPHLILLINVLGQNVNMAKEKTMQKLFRPDFLYLAQYFVSLPITKTCFPKLLQTASSYQLDY